jgi:hypothetical protein
LFVYRRSRLTKDLSGKDTRRFLSFRGYDINNNLDEDIAHLKTRLELRNKYSVDEFPHEIGLFLSYPLCDVIGFIKNRGRNFRLLGHWKVYSNVRAVKKLFKGYNECKNTFFKKFSEGISIPELIDTVWHDGNLYLSDKII